MPFQSFGQINRIDTKMPRIAIEKFPQFAFIVRQEFILWRNRHYGDNYGAHFQGGICRSDCNCGGDRALMRREIELLFCHGLLHLLGYDHATRDERARMQRKQAEYLNTSEADAWRFGPKTPPRAPKGGSRRIGRG